MSQEMKITELLEKIKVSYQAILQDKLVGIYVHGSIAFGCFTWANGDMDFLVVVRESLTQKEKEALIAQLLSLDEHAPKKGFEMSVVLQSVCNPFRYPTPYELHYSNAYRERYKENLAGICAFLHGEDKDLAAHVTVINAVGFPLCGPAVSEVFGVVPKEDYLDSILYDVEEAEEGICENPVYFILNLCRVVAYAQEEVVLSKKQGGEWGLKHLPVEYKRLLERALEVYRGMVDEMSEICGGSQLRGKRSSWSMAELKEFVGVMRKVIRGEK